MPKTSFYSGTGITSEQADAIESSANAAAQSAADAATSEANARLSELASASSQTQAADYTVRAETAADAAELAKTSAQSSAAIAEQAETNAVAAQAQNVASASFNPADGVMTFTRQNGNTFLASLNGRYLTQYTELNDLTTNVTWADVPNVNITEGSVTQHEAAIRITESQITDFGTYLTSHQDISGKANLSGANFTGNVATTGTLSTGGFTLPSTDGTNGQALLTNGSGTVSWGDVSVDLSNYLTDYTVTESDVTAHQAALSITESQISDLGTYLTDYTVTESDVTAHQAALSVTESQISDLGTYLTSHQDISGKANLSGANFTGNVIVDTDVLFVDSVNDYVGINKTPTDALDVEGNILCSDSFYVGSGHSGNSSGRSLITGSRNTNNSFNNFLAGADNEVNGQYCIVGGSDNTTTQGTGRSLIAGNDNSVSGGSMLCVGIENTIHEGTSGIVGGFQNTVSNTSNVMARQNLVVGEGNTVESNNNAVSGKNNTITTTDSACVGQENTISGAMSNVCGYENNVTGEKNVVGGHQNTVSGLNSGTFGQQNTVSNGFSVVTGYGNTVGGQFNSVSGVNNNVSNDQNTVGGDGNFANGKNCLAVGYQVTAGTSTNWFSTALGYQTRALGNASFAGGTIAEDQVKTESIGNHSFAYGKGAKTYGNAENSVALGYLAACGESNPSNQQTANQAMAIGYNCAAYRDNSFAGGNTSYAFGDTSFAFGNGANASHGYSNVALGLGVTTPNDQSTADGNGQVAVGQWNEWSYTGTNQQFFAVGTGTGEMSRFTSIAVGPRTASFSGIVMEAIKDSPSYSNDTDAGNNGVPVGGLYRTGSALKVRIS